MKDLYIKLDSPDHSYNPGDIVTGRVVLTSNRPIEVKNNNLAIHKIFVNASLT